MRPVQKQALKLFLFITMLMGGLILSSPLVENVVKKIKISPHTPQWILDHDPLLFGGGMIMVLFFLFAIGYPFVIRNFVKDAEKAKQNPYVNNKAMFIQQEQISYFKTKTALDFVRDNITMVFGGLIGLILLFFVMIPIFGFLDDIAGNPIIIFIENLWAKYKWIFLILPLVYLKITSPSQKEMEETLKEMKEKN